jgi:hypothetical protein
MREPPSKLTESCRVTGTIRSFWMKSGNVEGVDGAKKYILKTPLDVDWKKAG